MHSAGHSATEAAKLRRQCCFGREAVARGPRICGDAGCIANRSGGIPCSTHPDLLVFSKKRMRSPRSSTSQQGQEIPGRSTAGRGDSRGHAPDRRSPAWATDQGPDRGSVASRLADLGGPRPGRV